MQQGPGLKTAGGLLGNMGLKVEAKGKVKSNLSIIGTKRRFSQGQSINLQLN